MNPELLIRSGCINAEGPVWDDRTQTFYFIDVEAGKLFSWKNENLTVWEAGEKIGCAVIRENGGVLAALQSGFYAVDFPDGGKNPALRRALLGAQGGLFPVQIAPV